MKKIIDVGPLTKSSQDASGWLESSAKICANGSASIHAKGLRELRRRIEDAPEVTDTTVLIDVADPAQVGRLADAFCMARWEHIGSGDECDPLTRESMEQALRKYAEPYPDEPTGLGAVVLVAGEPWVRIRRHDGSDRHWRDSAQGVLRSWDELSVDEVKSQGVDL